MDSLHYLMFLHHKSFESVSYTHLDVYKRQHLGCPEAKTSEEVAGDILDVIVQIPFAGREKFPMQPQHIPKGANQFHVQIVIKIFHLIAAAFQFFQVGSRHTHHIGQLVHCLLYTS